MDENMIPRLVTGRLGFVGVIPSLARHAAQIDRYDYAAVVIQPVRNNSAEIVVDSRYVSSLCVCQSY